MAINVCQYRLLSMSVNVDYCLSMSVNIDYCQPKSVDVDYIKSVNVHTSLRCRKILIAVPTHLKQYEPRYDHCIQQPALG